MSDGWRILNSPFYQGVACSLDNEIGVDVCVCVCVATQRGSVDLTYDTSCSLSPIFDKNIDQSSLRGPTDSYKIRDIMLNLLLVF